MTPDDARAFCDGLQERVTQLGERTGEGQYIGQCLSVIRGLAEQIDALTPADPSVSGSGGGDSGDVIVEAQGVAPDAPRSRRR